MRFLKFIGIVLLLILLGGIALQAMGYIDSPIFNWFTELHLFN